MTEPSQSDRPDLKNGIPDGDLADGAMLVGQVGEEQVLLARRGREVFAIGATCTHYGGPLGEGLMVAEALSRQLSTSQEGARSNQVSCCDGILPLRRRFGSEGPQRGPGDEVALKIERVVDGGMDTEEALRGSS